MIVRTKSTLKLAAVILAFVACAAHAEAATLTVSPTTVTGGATVTANWNAIATPVSTDWIGLHTLGAPDSSYLHWVYVSCSRTAGSAAASGFCPFALPSPLAQGNYELRLFGAGSYNRLATSNPMTVPGASLTANPAVVAPGAAVMATWNGIATPTGADWIALYAVGEADTAYLNWLYVNCTRSAGSAAGSGSCPVTVPSSVANGSYELRLFASNSYGRLAVSNSFTVSPNTGPTVSIGVPTPSVAENAAPGVKGVIRVNRTGSTTAAVTVFYSRGGSATNGIDYVALPTSITIPAGSAYADIEVIPLNDSSSEGDETVVISLASDASYALGTPAAGTVTIVDDDPPLPVVTITATDAIATEGTPATDTGAFTVTRTGSTAQPLTVDFAISGTAFKDTDYTLGTGANTSITIPATSLTAVITVTPIDDNLVEPNETVAITLSPKANVYTLGVQTAATVTIVDNDVPVGPSIAASPGSVGQGGVVTATWSGIISPTSRDWIGLYSTAGGGYLAWIYVSCTQSAGNPMAAGSCPMTVPSSASLGSYQLRLFANNSNTLLATSNAFNVIALPVVSITASDGTTTEGTPSDTGVFTVSRTGSTAAALTVSYTIGGTATNGGDYDGLSGSVIIPIGAVSVPITVVPREDNLVEGNETVIITLTSSSAYTVGAPGSAAVTIVDNDVPPAPSLTVSPGIASSGSSVMVSWSGIVSPSHRDWMGLYAVGAPDANYLSWMFVSCSQNAGSSAIPSGACVAVLPGNLANGLYGWRLFANSGYTRLSTSNQMLVTPQATNIVIVAPARNVLAAPNVATLSIARQECNTAFSIPYIQTSNSLSVTAISGTLPNGGGVKFVLNENSAGEVVQFAMASPYRATFAGLAKGEYRVDAYIVDSTQNVVAGALNRDFLTQLGIGDIYVAIGDSITEGYDGVAYNVAPYTSWLAAPIASIDQRNYPQCGIASGAYRDHWQEASHHIALNDRLEAFFDSPNFILNEGVAGINAGNYLSRMLSAQWQNRMNALRPNKWLIHLGSNDPGGSATFQNTMQSIINVLKNTYGATGSDIVLAVPQNKTNWQPYINNLIAGNGLTAGPDFNAFYLNHPSLVNVNNPVHPNPAGHAEMARLWAPSLMAPENVVAQSGGTGQVQVSWDDLRLLEPTIAGFRVFYGSSPAALTSVVNVGAATSTVINVAGGTYYFSVQAYDNDAILANVTGKSVPVSFP